MAIFCLAQVLKIYKKELVILLLLIEDKSQIYTRDVKGNGPMTFFEKCINACANS